MANKEFDRFDDQFVISPELLQLMDWIVQYESETLKRIIARALKNGLKKNNPLLVDQDSTDLQPDEMQRGFVDFLMLMELLLQEVVHERSLKNAVQRNLVPALSAIDTSACDENTLQSSLAIATSQIERNPQANPREVLLKELLKQWKPHKKKTLHS